MSPGAKPVAKGTWCIHCNTSMPRERDTIIRHLKTEHNMPTDESLIAAIMENTDRGTTPENKKLWAALLDVQVFPFIDKAQLVKSSVFQKMVDEAIHFAIKDGNLTPSKNILTRFAKTRYFQPIACCLADRAALRINVKNGEIIIHLSKKTKVQEKTLTAYLDKYKNNNKDAFGEEEGKAKKYMVLIEREAEEYIDIMDTPMLLPGSFGSGKKR